MPAFPGAHLVLVHAYFALAPFEARFNACARLGDPHQFRQRRLSQLPLGHTRRTEIVMRAVAGIPIGGIARGAGPPWAIALERLPSDDQPYLGSGTFTLQPRLDA